MKQTPTRLSIPKKIEPRPWGIKGEKVPFLPCSQVVDTL